jgi:predicted nucleotidyltransferase
MGLGQETLDEIVRRILIVARPEKIILFGSAATGEMTGDSDIDLLVVERNPGNRHEERLRIADAIGDIEFPLDVVVMASERFDATKEVIGGIAFPAHKYGKVLYSAA